MSTPFRLPAVLMALPLFFLFSCTKVYDFVKDNPLEVASCCQIQVVDYEDGIFYKVSYNAAGNPVSFVSQAFSPFPDQYFRYDRQGRLKDCIATYNATTYAVSWDRYTYPGPGLMSDSTFEYQGDFTQLVNPHDLNLLNYAALYHLDLEGRPVSYTFNSRNGTSSGTIQYDHAGNQVLPGVTYDNKVNVYQTNKVWQQIYKNYSRNNPNPGTIAAYNNYGLPVTYLANSLLQPSLFFLPPTNYLIRVTYSCDSTKLPGKGPSPLAKQITTSASVTL